MAAKNPKFSIPKEAEERLLMRHAAGFTVSDEAELVNLIYVTASAAFRLTSTSKPGAAAQAYELLSVLADAMRDQDTKTLKALHKPAEKALATGVDHKDLLRARDRVYGGATARGARWKALASMVKPGLFNRSGPNTKKFAFLLSCEADRTITVGELCAAMPEGITGDEEADANKIGALILRDAKAAYNAVNAAANMKAKAKSKRT